MVAPILSSAQAAMVGKFIDNGALRLLDIIGCGGFGAVFRAFEPRAVKDFDNKLYAVKVVAKKREGSGRLSQLRELAFHMEVALHPHIVSFHRAFSDSEYRYIVLDNVPGGDLFSAITEKATYLCEEELTKMVFLQLIDALAFCHAKGVYHRDVKPENVLVSADGRHWYLSDFGLATDSVRSASFKMGSKGYMSPEVVNAGKQYDFYYPRLNDIWALGAVFINVLASCGLWEEAVPTDYHYSFYLRNRDYIHYALPVTRSASHIIRRILEPIPEERISLAELRIAIAEVDRFYPSAAELRCAEPNVAAISNKYIAIRMRALEAEFGGRLGHAFLDAGAKDGYFSEDTSLVYLATPSGTTAAVISPPAIDEESQRLHLDAYVAARNDLHAREQDDGPEPHEYHTHNRPSAGLNPVPAHIAPPNAPFPTPPITPPTSAPMPALSPNYQPSAKPSADRSNGPKTPESHAVRNADLAPGARSFEELVLALSGNQYRGEVCSTHLQAVALPAAGPAYYQQAQR